jgi:hypothetical protein
MNMKAIVFSTALAGLLLLGGVSSPTCFAMGGYTPDQMLTGAVQSIDYLHHTITVDGQTYAVSPQAKFTGIGGFSVLHIGMPVQCMLSSATATGPDDDTQPLPSDVMPVIIAVTWTPGSA